MLHALVSDKDFENMAFDPTKFDAKSSFGSFSLLIEPSSGSGKDHWSVTLSHRGIKSIQAINHKFATWKTIMSDESIYGKLPQGYLISLRNLLPNQLFAGDKAHDLGSILPSEG